MTNDIVKAVAQAALKNGIEAIPPDERGKVAIIVVVRPLEEGLQLNVSSSIIGDRRAIARFLTDATVAVERSGADGVEPSRIIVPS